MPVFSNYIRKEAANFVESFTTRSNSTDGNCDSMSPNTVQHEGGQCEELHGADLKISV